LSPLLAFGRQRRLRLRRQALRQENEKLKVRLTREPRADAAPEAAAEAVVEEVRFLAAAPPETSGATHIATPWRRAEAPTPAHRQVAAAAAPVAAAAPRKSARKAAAVPAAQAVSPLAGFKYPPVRCLVVATARSAGDAERDAVACVRTQVTGDGFGILLHDPVLNEHRGHLGYRCVRLRARSARHVVAPADAPARPN
jgi:hypothetical protein